MAVWWHGGRGHGAGGQGGRGQVVGLPGTRGFKERAASEFILPVKPEAGQVLPACKARSWAGSTCLQRQELGRFYMSVKPEAWQVLPVCKGRILVFSSSLKLLFFPG